MAYQVSAILMEPSWLLALVLPGVFLIWWLTRKRALPGKLFARGYFETEDPANLDAIKERERDFFRIAGTKRDLWIFTDSSRKPGTVLPVDGAAGGSSGADAEIKPCLQRFKFWLQGELGKIPGAIDLGMTSKWPVFDRLVYLTSVTPGFEFVMRHQVPPMLLQSKYVVMISKSGQVRLAWYAFMTDKPQPGSTAGPFVGKIVSEDLNAERERDRSHTVFRYTVTPTREKDMDKFIAGQTSLIMKGIDEDVWEPFLSA